MPVEELEHRAVFRGAAAQMMGHRGGEVVLAGPAGTGKSRACLTKLHLAMLKYPGAKALMVRKTGRSLAATTIKTWLEQVIPEARASGTVSYYGGSEQEPPCYRYDNGSRVVIGGLDNPDKVLSSDYALIFVDECTDLTQTDWQVLTTRLRHPSMPYRQLLGACNPGAPTHWLLNRARGPLLMLHSRHADNPAYVRADGAFTEAGQDYLDRLNELTGVQRERLLEGRWTAAEGVVYAFDQRIHMVPRFNIPAEWPVLWGVDFGFTNPFSWFEAAIDPDGRIYVVREIYHTRRTVDVHAARILELSDRRPAAIVCDHQAENRAVLARELGMDTVPAHKTVDDGIQAVQRRLKPAGDGRPRLMVMEDTLDERDPALVEAGKPTCLVEEFGGYVWDARKEAPVKANDHALDNLRYLTAHEDLAPRREVAAVRSLPW